MKHVVLVCGKMRSGKDQFAVYLSEELAKAEIPCQWHLSLGMAHGIDSGGLLHGGLFIAAAFGIKVAR